MQQSASAQPGASVQQQASGSGRPSSTEGSVGQTGGQSSGQDDAGAGQTELTIDEFARVQLRAGKVVEASAHPNADRLLVLKVDIGSEVRQIVAGIAKYYDPRDLVGKTIVIVANLKPAKLRGVESQGMLLAASTDDDSVLRLVTVDGDIAPGSAIR